MKNKIKRFFPLLCCVALIVSLLVPASAATSYDPEGEWIFDAQISPPPFTYLSVDFVCKVSGAEVNYSAFRYDQEEHILSYELENGNWVNVWSRRSGWANDDYRYVHIGLFDGYITDEILWSWFQNNAVQMTDYNGNSFFTTTAYINNVPFVFSASGSSPDVSATVTSSGITLSSGLRSKTWTYSGSGTFLGFSYSVDASEPTFSVNSTITFPGTSGANSRYSLFPVPPDDGSGTSPEVPPTDFGIVRAGVWRVKRDASGAFLPPATWPDPSDYFNPYTVIPFLSNDLQFRWISVDASGSLLYNRLLPSEPASDSIVAYHSSFGWASDYTTLLVQEDCRFTSALYDWFTSTFEYLSDNPDVGIYYTRVLIFDHSGQNLLDQYIAFQDDTSKQLDVRFTSSGLYLVSGSINVFTYVTPLVGGFEGFSLQPNSGAPDYSSGDTLLLGGASSNSTLVLYETFVPPFNDPADIVLSDFLVNAISGFMDFQLFPGASLSDLLWFVICIGALFVFLRMIV